MSSSSEQHRPRHNRRPNKGRVKGPHRTIFDKALQHASDTHKNVILELTTWEDKLNCKVEVVDQYFVLVLSSHDGSRDFFWVNKSHIVTCIIENEISGEDRQSVP